MKQGLSPAAAVVVILIVVVVIAAIGYFVFMKPKGGGAGGGGKVDYSQQTSPGVKMNDTDAQPGGSGGGAPTGSPK